MATTAITTASETKEWVLACSENEQCQIEVLKNNISFVESELQPPTDPKETLSMHLLQNIPRDFQGDGTDKIWVFIDNKDIVRKRPYTPMRLHDARGNPISSFKGAIDVHNADVHDEIYSRYLHLHDESVVSTLAVATVGDGTEFEITLDDATDFQAGYFIHVNTATVETTHPKIISKTGNVLTLDRRIDNAHGIGDEVTRSIIDISGTVTAGTMANPHIFVLSPEPDEVLDLYRILIAMVHDSAGDLSKFGNLPPLINGVVLRTVKNGVYTTFTNWKTNTDIKNDMYDISFDDRAGGQGSYSTSGRLSLFKTGGLIRIDGATNDRVELLVQDDIRALGFFGIKNQGHFDNK